MRLVKLLVAVSLALAGCGDDKGRPDAAISHDASDAPDAPGVPPPPPPLGAQIDRMGRPAISTALVGLLAPTVAARAAKDAYNHATDPATWRTTLVQTNVTIERELETNLAVFDVLDRGLAGITGAGCGNALRYGGTGQDAYKVVADLFADDQLYVDTSKATCPIYFALDMERATLGDTIHTTCGGRTLTHDVIDVTYSLFIAGRNGLDLVNGLSPKLHDGVAAHSDVDVAFPFLGPPHVP